MPRSDIVCSSYERNPEVQSVPMNGKNVCVPKVSGAGISCVLFSACVGWPGYVMAQRGKSTTQKTGPVRPSSKMIRIRTTRPRNGSQNLPKNRKPQKFSKCKGHRPQNVALAFPRAILKSPPGCQIAFTDFQLAADPSQWVNLAKFLRTRNSAAGDTVASAKRVVQECFPKRTPGRKNRPHPFHRTLKAAGLDRDGRRTAPLERMRALKAAEGRHINANTFHILRDGEFTLSLAVQGSLLNFGILGVLTVIANSHPKLQDRRLSLGIHISNDDGLSIHRGTRRIGHRFGRRG